MNACCHAASQQKTPTRLRRVREALAWLLPSALLAFAPKCPACLAAYVTLWTGLGLSFSAATWLRWAMLSACVGALLYLIWGRSDRIGAIFNYVTKETKTCNTK